MSDHHRGPEPPDDVFILTEEDGALAEQLGEISHGDWARILYMLSPSAKDEIRAAIGLLAAKLSMERED